MGESDCSTKKSRKSAFRNLQNTGTKSGFRKNRRRQETVHGEVYDPEHDVEPMPAMIQKTEEDMEDLKRKVKKTAFLKEIDDKRLTAALNRMSLKAYDAGDVIFRQGEPGNLFYIVHSGTYRAYEKEEDGDEGLGDPKDTFDCDNPCFGELALLFAEHRPYTVRCESNGELWQIERRAYTRVVVRMAFEKRQRHMKFMKKTPILGQVQHYERVRLCDAFVPMTFKAGQVIIKEGDKADGMYWIEKGTVLVRKKDGTTAELGESRFFGEMALLTKQPRNATCIAETDCDLVFLETEAFERLLGKLHNIMLRDKDKYKAVLKEELGTEDVNNDNIR